MKNNALIGGLRIAMQALAGKFGVGLTFSGNTAYTDHKRINLPVLDEVDDRDVAILARGYIDHEAAHIRFTAPDIMMTVWLNILEDIRIERLMAMEYPGTSFNLRKLVAHLKRDGESFRGVPERPVSVLQSWALCWGRSHLLGQELEDYAGAMRESAEDIFGTNFCDAFMVLLEKMPGCASTEDCQRLAEEIESLIRQNPPPRPPEQEDQEGSSGFDQDKQVFQDDAHDRQSHEKGDPAGVEAHRDEEDCGQGVEEEKADVQERFDLGQILRGLLQEAVEENQTAGAQGAGSYFEESDSLIANTFYGEMDWSRAEYDVRQDYAIWHPHASRCLEDVDATKRQTAQLRAGLAGLLQSVRLKRSRSVSSGQRLGSGNCHLIGTGTPDVRVFSSRQPRVDNNTAVAILADTSSSMQTDNRYRVATQALYVVAKALDVMPGVATVVGHFPAAWTIEEEMAGVRVIKDFGERAKLESFVLTPVGGTPINAALLWGGMQLGSRPEPRKILLVLTDGDICQREVTRTVVERVMRAGVEVYAIGIVEADVSTWLPPGNGVNICDIAELPKAMVGMLKKALVVLRWL